MQREVGGQKSRVKLTKTLQKKKYNHHNTHANNNQNCSYLFCHGID